MDTFSKVVPEKTPCIKIREDNSRKIYALFDANEITKDFLFQNEENVILNIKYSKRSKINLVVIYH